MEENTPHSFETPARRDWRFRLRSAAVVLFARCWVRLIRATCRLETVAGRLPPAGSPRVIAFWHEHTLLAAVVVRQWLVPRGTRMAVLASRSRDGDLPAELARAWGIQPIRGSSSRGGVAGLRALLREVHQGRWPLIAPDGPRGPRRQSRPGAVAVAQLAGIPVQALAVECSRCRRLGTWDRMVLPLPFSTIYVAWGSPRPAPQRGRSSLDDAAVETGRELDALMNLLPSPRP